MCARNLRNKSHREILNCLLEEIYATYAKGWQPDEVLEMDHDEIARILIVEHGLTPDAADFAADQIILVAERINGEER